MPGPLWLPVRPSIIVHAFPSQSALTHTRKLKITAVLDAAPFVKLGVPPDNAPPRTNLVVTVGDRTLHADLATKSVRKAIRTLLELGEQNITLIIQGSLEADHFAIAIGSLSIIAAGVMDHSEAVPAVMHVGEAAEQVACCRLGLVKLSARTKPPRHWRRHQGRHAAGGALFGFARACARV
jgi:hypothetical protein